MSTRYHYSHERYERLKAEGVCVRCAKRPARPEKVHCQACADYLHVQKTTEAAHRERRERYLWYKAHGICTECERRPAAIGLTRCPECAERLAAKPSRITPERRRELYLRRKANGTCTCCKSRKAEEGKVKCRECARKQHIAYMRRRVLRIRPDGQCIRCDNQARPGSKLCEKHYAEAVKQCAYMRAKANPKAHVWHADNAIVFQTSTHKDH